MTKNYRDYFLSAPKKDTVTGYRIVQSVERTGDPFMYHSTKRYDEAVDLVTKYHAMEGIKVSLEKEA